MTSSPLSHCKGFITPQLHNWIGGWWWIIGCTVTYLHLFVAQGWSGPGFEVQMLLKQKSSLSLTAIVRSTKTGFLHCSRGLKRCLTSCPRETQYTCLHDDTSMFTYLTTGAWGTGWVARWLITNCRMVGKANTMWREDGGVKKRESKNTNQWLAQEAGITAAKNTQSDRICLGKQIRWNASGINMHAVYAVVFNKVVVLKFTD